MSLQSETAYAYLLARLPLSLALAGGHRPAKLPVSLVPAGEPVSLVPEDESLSVVPVGELVSLVPAERQ